MHPNERRRGGRFARSSRDGGRGITVSETTNSCKHNSSDCYPRLQFRSMTDFIQVATTTGTREVAERIAVELVDRRLAACAQVIGPIQSTYRWQGKVETAQEWTCVAKTSRVHFSAIGELLKELHPYEVPELIATPIVDGSEAYLKWLDDQLGGEQG